MKKKKAEPYQFPLKIEQFIQQFCKQSGDEHSKDSKAYTTKLYKALNNEFYELEQWELYRDAKNNNPIFTYINNYVSKYIPEYQKQSTLSQLSPTEKIIQPLLQQYKSYSKFTNPLKEDNSKEVDEQILALNAMSRIFSKEPYSSLVYKVTENKLFLGTNSDRKDMSLQKMMEDSAKKQNSKQEESFVQKISLAFKNFVNIKNEDTVRELLKYMQADANPILANILSTVVEIKSKFNIDFLSGKQLNLVIDLLINEKDLEYIKQYKFHDKAIIESYPFGHGEMNALASSRGVHGDNIHKDDTKSQYIIGLASSNYGKINIEGNKQGENPFSCMGCSSEIEVLRKIIGLKISIGYMSVDSMHFSEFYRPSLNIIFDSKLAEAWCKEIELSITQPKQTMEQRTQKLDFNYDEEKKKDEKVDTNLLNTKEIEKNKLDINILISQLDEKEFKLFWNVYHNAEIFKLQNVVDDLYEYAYRYVLNFKSQNSTYDKNYFFGSERTISDMEYQLIDIEVNAIGKQLLSNYNINYIGSIGQGIGIGIDNTLPTQVDIARPIIGIYNPGNGFYGHWVTFVIVKINENKYTVYLKDSFGNDIDKYPGLKQAIEKKYGTEKIGFIHHTGNEQKQDGTSCGIYALANAKIIAKWLILDKEGKNFNGIEFITSEEIQNLRNQYNQTNIELQKHQEDESETSQALSNNLTKIVIEQEHYKNVLLELKSSFSTIAIQQEEWTSNTGNFKAFSESNAVNTIFVGISFGEHRNLMNQHKYNITIQVSNDLGDKKAEINKLLSSKNIKLEELQIENTIFAKALESLHKLYGINDGDGLTIESINLNLDNIIKSYDQADLYINPKIIDGSQVLNNVLNWLTNNNIFKEYSAIVKVENDIGKKHAILLHAKQKDGCIESITLTDPLSHKYSEFLKPLDALKMTLSNQITSQVQVIYAGLQDKEHGTCGDISLIMLQELIEKPADNYYLYSNYLEHIKQQNYIKFYNFDYDNLQHIEVTGDVTSFH